MTTTGHERCSLCGKAPLCSGRGVIVYDVPVDHHLFGKFQRCPNHNVEHDAERQEKLRKLSNLEAFEDKTFTTFLIDQHLVGGQQKSLQFAYDLAFSFASEPRGWLLLEGSYGTGKTHLAAAIGNERLKRGDQVLFITTPDLLDHLRNAYAPSAETGYDELFDRIRNAPLLILDDLGVENPSPWAQEKLFQLLNHRYSYQMPTVITTNQNIDTFDPRIRSRLLDTNVIRRTLIDVPDYRSVRANEQNDMTMLELYAEMRFDTFNTHDPAPEMQNHLRYVSGEAYKYARKPSGWFVLLGKHGVGKTHLAAAIAHEQKMRGVDVIFITTAELLDRLRITFGEKSDGSFDERFNRVRKVDLLVLDDYDSDMGSSWTREKLFQIIDYRFVAKRPTVITTTKEKMSDRLDSRIFDTRVSQPFKLECEPYYLRSRKTR